ncbi:MAG: pyruvate kinase [Syntrophobacteraceae bacterium CG2_30_61_12]|nr:MAG: pyruvate kinase [Syntrophobacteraceae bacterium CG2_30_61_12]
MTLPANKTKIVCTIGPASRSREVMEKLLLAGMNIARLNFSHGDFSGHREVIADLRAAAMATGRRLAIMADLPGPKMRIGTFDSEPIELKPDDLFTLTTDDIVGDAHRVSVTFTRLPQVVKPGDTLYLNDGLIQVAVDRVQGPEVRCRVLVGGELRARKGLNLPDIDLGVGAFTEHDHNCLKFALENGVDAVSQSFVENAADIEAVRDAAAALGFRPFIIAKIERSRALKHLDAIIDAADAIMIARGDLGVELPIEQIPVVQKQIMRQANRRAKPVITATQMLESMITNRRPTRAEATDVANAILDGTDCVMLSGESAMGDYPVDAAAMLVKIATAIEPYRTMVSARELFKGIDLKGKVPPAKLIDLGVESVLEYADPAAVFVPTRGGDTARSIARFRLPIWIVAVTSEEATCRRLQFTSGVYPVCEAEHPDHWSDYVRHWLRTHGVDGNLAVVTEGPSRKHPDANNRLEIVDLDRNGN